MLRVFVLLLLSNLTTQFHVAQYYSLGSTKHTSRSHSTHYWINVSCSVKQPIAFVVTHSPADCQATFISTTFHYDLQGVEDSFTYLLLGFLSTIWKYFTKFLFLTPLPNVRRKFCQIITTNDGVQNSEPRGFLQFLPTSVQTEPPPGIPNYPFKSRYSGKCFYQDQHGLCLELYTACIIHMYFLQTWMLHTPT